MCLKFCPTCKSTNYPAIVSWVLWKTENPVLETKAGLFTHSSSRSQSRHFFDQFPSPSSYKVMRKGPSDACTCNDCITYGKEIPSLGNPGLL